MISDKDLKDFIGYVDKDKFSMFYDMAKELQQRRASELRPATKFLGTSKYDQFKSVNREFEEVKEAFNYIWQFPSDPKPIGYDKAMDHLLEELADLQMSCETMMAIVGADETKRNDIRRQVIEKNAKRGYYEEAQK
jgi:hypothetical protein